MKDSLQELYKLTGFKAEAIMANNKARNQQKGNFLQFHINLNRSLIGA
jgi:hypothetical protein